MTRLFILAFLFVASAFTIGSAHAWNEVKSERTFGVLELEMGRSTVIQADANFSMIAVADPDVAEAMVTNDRLFFVRGTAPGITTILLYNEAGQLVEMVELEVRMNLAALERDLAVLLPGEPIRVHPVKDSVFLTGVVSNGTVADQAVQIADRHMPGRVTSALSIGQAEQVMLEVRFVEASRDALKEIGFQTRIDANDVNAATGTGLISGSVGSATALFSNVGGENIDIRLQALESEGSVQTLARPNLVALSGDTASFLAGGEFPIPVAGGDGEVTVQFREFGVSLAFTPVVLDGDLINLRVRPEVSAIDNRNSVVTASVAVPSLTTRRVETSVELRDGQAFAIAGLLQDRITEESVGVPLLKDIPVLGKLFSSERYQREETELVIIVTPRLVKPASSPEALSFPVASLEPSPKHGRDFYQPVRGYGNCQSYG